MTGMDGEAGAGGSDRFELTGGHVALDFANTVDSRPTDMPRERLTCYGDLLDWSEQAGLLTRSSAGGLRTLADGHSRAASRVMGRARELRELIHELFSAIARGRSLPAEALRRFNEVLPEAMIQARLERTRGGVRWSWSDEATLDRMLWPIIRSAAELMTSDERERTRLCAADDCGWLFLDESRNRSRRWCDMSVCGNRSKVRRFREAHRRRR